MEQIKNHVQHEFAPIYDEYSQILILGTLPSVKSRENHFYYGHPQNRFWKLLAYLTQVQIPETIEQKKSFLLEHHIAVWDVIAECDIIGSSDSSISNVTPTDLSRVLSTAPIRQIYANGATAAKLYHKYQENIAVYQPGECCLFHGTAGRELELYLRALDTNQLRSEGAQKRGVILCLNRNSRMQSEL